jgi:hypothetical protein
MKVTMKARFLTNNWVNCHINNIHGMGKGWVQEKMFYEAELSAKHFIDP